MTQESTTLRHRLTLLALGGYPWTMMIVKGFLAYYRYWLTSQRWSG